MESPIVELSQVSHQFGQLWALQHITLQIYPGECVAIVGPSGAGKSTLLHLLNGTLHPTQGEVWVLGQNLAQLSASRLRRVQQHIGMVHQQLHLVDNLAVVHNVNAGQLGRWSIWKAALSLLYPLEVETAARALQQVGIPEKLYVRTDQLSGGQQQRVAIARVLVQNPQVILADEPVASLDPERSRSVMQLLRTLAQAGEKTLIVSLHSVDLALSYCDRIIGLQAGQLIWDSPSAAVTTPQLADLYRLQE